MIAHVHEALAEVVASVLVGVRNADTRFPLPPSVRYIVDTAGAGPLAGVHAGLRATETPWLLVIACDLPAINPASLHELIQACEDEFLAVVAQSSEGRAHPLCACYHRDVLPVVDAQLLRGHLAMHMLLEQLPTRYVSLPDATLQNVNSLADLEDFFDS